FAASTGRAPARVKRLTTRPPPAPGLAVLFCGSNRGLTAAVGHPFARRAASPLLFARYIPSRIACHDLEVVRRRPRKPEERDREWATKWAAPADGAIESW